MFKSHCPLLLYSAILYPPGLTSKLQTQILKHWDSQNLLFMHFYPIFLNPTEVEIITRIIAVCCSNFEATQNILHRHHTQHYTTLLWTFDSSVRNVDILHYLQLGLLPVIIFKLNAWCILLLIKVWRVIISCEMRRTPHKLLRLWWIGLNFLNFHFLHRNPSSTPSHAATVVDTLSSFLLYWKGNKNTVINGQSNDQCIYCLCRKLLKSSWKWNKISISRKKITLHLCLKKCCKRCLQTLVKYIIQWQQHLILEERTPLQRMTNLRAGAGLLLATTVMTYHIIKQEDTSIFYNTHVRPLFTQGWLQDWCHLSVYGTDVLKTTSLHRAP